MRLPITRTLIGGESKKLNNLCAPASYIMYSININSEWYKIWNVEKIPSLGNYTLAKEEQDSSRFEINFIFIFLSTKRIALFLYQYSTILKKSSSNNKLANNRSLTKIIQRNIVISRIMHFDHRYLPIFSRFFDESSIDRKRRKRKDWTKDAIRDRFRFARRLKGVSWSQDIRKILGKRATFSVFAKRIETTIRTQNPNVEDSRARRISPRR